MPLQHIHSEGEFQSALGAAGGKLVVVDWFAEWCGPCKRMEPQMQRLVAEYPDVHFLKVDVDECQSLAMVHGVQAMPTFGFYQNSQKLHSFSGADPNQLEAKIKEYMPKFSAFVGEGQSLGGSSSLAGSTYRNPYRDADWVPPSERQTQPTASTSELPAPSPAAALAASAASASEPPAAQGPVNEELLAMLVSMGFSQSHAERALRATSNANVDTAVNWMLENPDTGAASGADTMELSSPAVSQASGAPATAPASASAPAPAESSQDDSATAQSESKSSQGESADDSKPELTLEQKKRALEQKARELRLKKEEEEKKMALEREKKRRESGKELVDAKAKFEQQERKRIADARKREMNEDKRERERLRKLLQADKDRRKREAEERKRAKQQS